MPAVDGLRLHALVAFALVLATLAAYGGFADFEFVNFDDRTYITRNAQVSGGLTLDSARWALTATAPHNWHPLTWMSHMLDVELFGLEPVAHHRVNLLLHLVASLLLYAAWLRMTRAPVRSAVLAGFFALHPLHVESVAWISERKDVLSAVFFAGTLWAYAGYAARPSISRYLAVAALCAAGLASKPMLVTLPGVLLLLDIWPLERARLEWADASKLGRLVLEKLPLLALCAGTSAITILAQERAITLWGVHSLPDRLSNAVVSYVRYLGKTAWPADLSVMYPHPGQWAALSVVGCLALLAVFSAWILMRARSSPHLAVGWGWFLGMLVPVIGLIQVGEQAMADRYMYLPSIGLFVMATWHLPTLVPATLVAGRALLGLALTALVACSFATAAQVVHWKNSNTLWEHALAVDPMNSVALAQLADLADDERRFADALVLLRRAVEIAPDRAATQYNLGNLLMRMQQWSEAIGPLREALRLRPGFARALESLGTVHSELGETRAAIELFERALQHRPDSTVAHTNLAAALEELGDRSNAVTHYREALRLAPGEPYALRHLAALLASDDPALRDAAEAERLATEACEQSRYRNPIDLDALARAQAAGGHYDRAVETAERALAIARRGRAGRLASEIEMRLTRYRAQLR